MKHQDHQNCKHEKVKFCEKCNNVFCLKCKREWDYEPCQLNHLSVWANNPVSIYTIGKKSDDTGTPLPPYPTITCSNHVGEGDAN